MGQSSSEQETGRGRSAECLRVMVACRWRGVQERGSSRSGRAWPTGALKPGGSRAAGSRNESSLCTSPHLPLSDNGTPQTSTPRYISVDPVGDREVTTRCFPPLFLSGLAHLSWRLEMQHCRVQTPPVLTRDPALPPDAHFRSLQHFPGCPERASHVQPLCLMNNKPILKRG